MRKLARRLIRFRSPPCPAGAAWLRVVAMEAAASLMLALIGCTGESIDPPEPDPSPARPAVLQRLDPARFPQIVAQHRGSVVLVDFWATWCQPCLALLPHTVELHEQLAGQGLAVIGVSMDEAQSEAQVREVLGEQKAPFEHYLAEEAGSAATTQALDIPSGLPHFKLYDRGGKLRRTFSAGTRQLNPDEIDRAVRDLLAEPGPQPGD